MVGGELTFCPEEKGRVNSLVVGWGDASCHFEMTFRPWDVGGGGNVNSRERVGFESERYDPR